MTRTEAESNAYRDGQVDERLTGMDRHFAAINGSVAETAAALNNVRLELSSQHRDISEIKKAVEKIAPTLHQLTDERTLRLVRTDGRAAWRTMFAWALGVVATLLLIGNLLAPYLH